MANRFQSVASRAREAIDRALLSVVRWRLAGCRRPKDLADHFADEVMILLAEEIARRNAENEGWAEQLRRAQVAEAEQMRRVAGLQAFEQLSESGDRLRQ